MKRSRPAMKTIAVLALAACASLALAQAPDWGPGPGGPGGPRAGAGPRGPQARQGMRGRTQALAPLVAGDYVQTEIANTDEGVKLTVLSTDEEKVGELQERVRAGVDRMEQTADRLGEQFAQAGPNARRLRRDPMMLLATGDVEIGVEEIDDGIVVSFSSDDPETVKALQEQMPQWVATAREAGQRQRQGAERRRQMQAARELLANEAVKLEVEETENGILVKVTSDDPELAAQVKENLTAYFEAQAEIARRAGQMGGRGRGAGAGGRGFGGPGQRFGPQGVRGMGRGPGGGQPPAPEF